MLEIIDLSQEIFSGMPVFPGLPEVAITVHASPVRAVAVFGGP
jgi:kynurenine formamidase